MWIIVISALSILIAFWVTWRDENMLWITAMLVVSMSLSNLVHFFGNPDNVPGVYTMAEIFVAVTAYVTWEYQRSNWQVTLGFLTAISITANIARALISHPDRMQINLHEGITNVIFILECFTTIGMGITHGVRSGRFNRWFDLRHETSRANGKGSWKA